jgi:transcriptional regulator with XRE-family HTH domain
MQDEGEHKNVKQFANYLGIKEKYFNLLWNGKRNPSDKIIQMLTIFFQDTGFYEAVGKERPDERLIYILKYWPDLSEEEKDRIMKETKLIIRKKGN